METAASQRLGVAGRVGPQGVLDPVAELGEHHVGHVVGELGDEEDADALGADQPHRLGDLVEEGRRGVGEQQVGLVEEEDQLRLVEVADLGEGLEQLGEQPHEEGREQLRPVLDRRQLEAADHAPLALEAKQVVDGELGLAEEGVAALVLELADRAQQHAGGRRRDPADGLQLGLALVAGQPVEHRLEVGEVEQRQAVLVGVAEDQRERRSLGLVRAEDLRQQLGTEGRHRCPHGHARTDASEGQEAGRASGRREVDTQLLDPVGDPLVGQRCRAGRRR